MKHHIAGMSYRRLVATAKSERSPGTGRRWFSRIHGPSRKSSHTTCGTSVSGERSRQRLWPRTTRRSMRAGAGQIEQALRAGKLRAVVTSTSLELGVDIGTADVTVQVGLPGGVARCVQRVGRSGHRRGAGSRGLLFAATPAELAGAIITARAALAGRVEPLRMIRAPLDVVCQQLVSMACAGEQNVDQVPSRLSASAGSMADLTRAEFDDCLASLAGDLTAPPGAFEPEPGAAPRWTSPRIWKCKGLFGIRSWRVARWFRSNVGTIHSEPTVRVMDEGVAVGTLEASYAERLVAGDRFVLDGQVFKFRRLENSICSRPV